MSVSLRFYQIQNLTITRFGDLKRMAEDWQEWRIWLQGTCRMADNEREDWVLVAHAYSFQYVMHFGETNDFS